MVLNSILGIIEEFLGIHEKCGVTLARWQHIIGWN
jgi:hypothetical protein